MVRDLNDVYDLEELFFYCNACGDINIPGTDPWSQHKPEDLPHSAWELYMNYWSEDTGLVMYVIEYKQDKCMAINTLFDRGYMDDLCTEYGFDLEEELYWRAVHNIAETYGIVTNCEVLAGRDTDPDGHEIYLIVPANRCDTIRELSRFLSRHIYGDFEREYENLLKGRDI